MILEELQRFSRQMPYWAWNLLLGIVAILIGLILRFILSKLAKYVYQNSSEYSFIRSAISRIAKSSMYFLPLLLLNFILPLMRLSRKTNIFWDKLIEVCLTAAFAYILISITRIAEDYLQNKYDLNKANNLRERKIRTQLEFIRKFIIGVIVIVTISVILLSFENMRKIGAGLLTGVGISGIIVGFAAQRSLGNLLAGFQIAFTQPIRIDDVLVVEGEFGKVEEITLTYVVLSLWDQRRLILPINYFIEKPFQNWTRATAELLGTIYIYADYTLPVEQVRKELMQLLQQHSLWDGRVSALQVTDSTKDTIQIRILVSARNSSEAFDLRCDIREKMITYILENFPNSLPKTRAEILNVEPV